MPKPAPEKPAPETDAQARLASSVDLDRVAAVGQQSLLAVAHLHSRLIRNALEVNAELLDFARKRVGEDISTSEKFVRCTNVAEAMEVVSGFYQKAISEYAEEADRLVKISASAANRSIEETRSEANGIG